MTAFIEYENLLKDLKAPAMRLTNEALGAVEFGRFRLLPHRRELRADGVAVELGWTWPQWYSTASALLLPT